MASPFTSIACTVRWDNARIVSWTMLPGANYPEDFILEVENSRAGGPWTTLATGLQGACCFVDSRKRNYNKRLNECYRVRMCVPSTGEVYVSDIADAGNHKAYPYSAEAENVIKQAETQIEMSGCSGKLLKKKLWGLRCPDCVDFSGQNTVNEHCPRCLGTGIDGGYFPGIKLWIIKDSISTAETTSELGYLQGETVQCRCIAYPYINLGDVWVEDDTNKRFYIAKVTPAASYKTTALVYQMVLQYIEQNDVLYTKNANEKVVHDNEQALPEATKMPSSAGWDEILAEP